MTEEELLHQREREATYARKRRAPAIAARREERLLRNRQTPARRRAYRLMMKYSLTPDALDAMIAAQDGRCACCGDVLEVGRGTHVDHDHVTGEVRGVLCHGCNTSIGKLGDTVDGVARAVAYLAGIGGFTNTAGLSAGMLY